MACDSYCEVHVIPNWLKLDVSYEKVSCFFSIMRDLTRGLAMCAHRDTNPAFHVRESLREVIVLRA